MATAHSCGERVILTGVVESTSVDAPVVLADAHLTLDGDTRSERFLRLPFLLRRGDGGMVTVDPQGARLVAPEQTHRGSWSALEGLPLAQPFRANAPGPQVRVRLDGAVVQVGEHVALAGVPCEFAFADEPVTFREAPARTVVTVRALVVAAGRRAEKHLQHALRELDSPPTAGKRLASRSRGPAAWVVGAILAGVLGAVLLPGSTFAGRLVESVLVLLVALMASRAAHLLPRFHPLTPGKTEGIVADRADVSPAATALLVGLPALLTMSPCFLGALISERWPSWRVGAEAVGLILASAVALFLLLRDRRGRLTVRSLVDAPPLEPSSPPGRWSSCTGQLGDVDFWRLDTFQSSTTQLNDGIDITDVTEHWDNYTQHVPELLRIQTSSGPVVLRPHKDGRWASFHTSHQRTSRREQSVLTRVPPGTRVLVAGRLAPGEKEPTFVVTGRASLLLFAMDHPAPRRWLQARLLLWHLAVGACLLAAAIGVAVLAS